VSQDRNSTTVITVVTKEREKTMNRAKLALATVAVITMLCPSAIQAASSRHGVAHRANIGTIKKDGTCADAGGIKLYSKSGQNGLCVRYTGTGTAELCYDNYPGTVELVCTNIASWSTLGSNGHGSFVNFDYDSEPFFSGSKGDLPSNFVNRTSPLNSD